MTARLPAVGEAAPRMPLKFFAVLSVMSTESPSLSIPLIMLAAFALGDVAFLL
jgi:hypothetical protein